MIYIDDMWRRMIDIREPERRMIYVYMIPMIDVNDERKRI
jgi:hypothetical protein